MNGSRQDDDECSAAPGVMGNRACHLWPGCGCGLHRVGTVKLSRRTTDPAVLALVRKLLSLGGVVRDDGTPATESDIIED